MRLDIFSLGFGISSSASTSGPFFDDVCGGCERFVSHLCESYHLIVNHSQSGDVNVLIVVVLPHSLHVCPEGRILHTVLASRILWRLTKFERFNISSVLNCFLLTGTDRLVRFIVADEELVNQALLIWMNQDMTSKIGDQLLPRLIVLDFCLWHSMNSLIDSLFQTQFSGCSIVECSSNASMFPWLLIFAFALGVIGLCPSLISSISLFLDGSGRDE